MVPDAANPIVRTPMPSVYRSFVGGCLGRASTDQPPRTNLDSPPDRVLARVETGDQAPRISLPDTTGPRYPPVRRGTGWAQKVGPPGTNLALSGSRPAAGRQRLARPSGETTRSAGAAASARAAPWVTDA